MILFFFPLFNVHFSSGIVTEKCVLVKAAGGSKIGSRKGKREERMG